MLAGRCDRSADSRPRRCGLRTYDTVRYYPTVPHATVTSQVINDTIVPSSHLDEHRGQSIVETWYLNSLTSPYGYFLQWVQSWQHCIIKKISCHFCHQIILREAGIIALRSGAHTLQCCFTSKMDANDHFILSVIDAYLTTALHGLKNNRKKNKQSWSTRYQRPKGNGRKSNVHGNTGKSI